MQDLINDFEKFVLLEIELRKRNQQPTNLVPAWNQLVANDDSLKIDESNYMELHKNKTI